MKDRQAADGIVTSQVLVAIRARIPTAAAAQKKLLALARREPHLHEMCMGSLIALGRLLRRTGAPRDAVELADSQLRLLSARLLGALALGDTRFRKARKCLPS